MFFNPHTPHPAVRLAEGLSTYPKEVAHRLISYTSRNPESIDFLSDECVSLFLSISQNYTYLESQHVRQLFIQSFEKRRFERGFSPIPEEKKEAVREDSPIEEMKRPPRQLERCINTIWKVMSWVYELTFTDAALYE